MQVTQRGSNDADESVVPVDFLLKNRCKAMKQSLSIQLHDILSEVLINWFWDLFLELVNQVNDRISAICASRSTGCCSWLYKQDSL